MSLRILTEEDFAKIEERRLKAAFTGPVRKGKRQADPERMDDNGELVNQVICGHMSPYLYSFHWFPPKFLALL